MAALTEEQSIIRDQAQSWVGDKGSVSNLRSVRDQDLPLRYAPETWSEMIEMGWSGILVPEAHGGSELGHLTFGLILEETGNARDLTLMVRLAVSSEHALFSLAGKFGIAADAVPVISTNPNAVSVLRKTR